MLRIASAVMLLLLGGAGHCAADTLSVPAPYETLGDAAAAAGDGDVIEIEAGSYDGTGIVATLDQSNLTVRGVNGFAHLNADGVVISNRKAILVTTGDNITLENIEFSNAAVPDLNGAGIRHEGGLLTVRNCRFHDNENGILTSGQDDGELFIEHSEFNHNGLGDAGYTHNIYVGHIPKFTMQYSYSRHATHGHNVKSRAAENIIRYNRIMDESAGNASYQIDLPNGGLSYIVGNTIHQGVNTENSTMISYAAEGLHTDNPIQELYVSGNTLVNDRSNGRGIRLSHSPTAVIVNNIFDNFSLEHAIDGDATVDQNNIVGTDNRFKDRSTFDFHLTADSPAVQAAGAPGVYRGVDLTPVNEYAHPLDDKLRHDDGQLDVGAFEYTDSADDPPADNPPDDDSPGDTDPDDGGSADTGGGGGCFISAGGR